MIWLLIGMAVDGLTTLAIGIVLSLTTAHPVMPQLPLHWHHPGRGRASGRIPLGSVIRSLRPNVNRMQQSAAIA